MINPKQIAGEKAAEYIQDGMSIGLGTGSTAYFAIKKIGERVKNEGLKLKCIATSDESEQLAKELNIPIYDFDEIKKLDITIDGADEVDNNFNLIKGGGGALLREKIIAYITQQYIIIVDESKVVEHLGKFHLPVEVTRFGWQITAQHLEALNCTTTLRKKNNEIFITDNGNYILDCDFKKIENPKALQSFIDLIPGVVEVGLFINRVNKLIVGNNDGNLKIVENKRSEILLKSKRNEPLTINHYTKMYKAFIFDMNGTMIDDMQYHTVAWHKVLNELGAPLSLEETKLEMYGKGEEMFDRVFGAGKFAPEKMHDMIMHKEIAYQDEFRPHLELIAGLDNFLQKAIMKNIGLAIGTAAPETNVDFVLDGLNLRKYFKTIVGAEDVEASKPDPEVFLKCAELLNVSPSDCIVFEDSPKGVEAARNGGFKAIAITSFHDAKDFEKFENILFIINNYDDKRLEQLF